MGATSTSHYHWNQGINAAPHPWSGNNATRTPGLEFGFLNGVVSSALSSALALLEYKSEHDPAEGSCWMDYLAFNVYGCPAIKVYSAPPAGFGGPAWASDRSE